MPEREFTYRIAWDDAATFAVGNVAQRPPVTTWRPIRVDDRLPPYTQSLGRPFTLDFPIRYTGANVGRHGRGAALHVLGRSTNDVVYVHMCHDGPPADADNLYLGPIGWGSVVINGDYLSLENIAIEQVSGTALKVNPSANGTVLRNVAARAAQVWLEGVNTVAEDLDVSHVIFQGPIGGTCYDANPDFGRGECWNAAGDGGALLVGRAGRDSVEGPGGAAGARASVVERRTDRRAADPDRVAVLGLSEPHAGGQRYGWCHQLQHVPERTGLHLSQ